MQQIDQIEIPLNKKKTLLSFLTFSAFFVGIGVFEVPDWFNPDVYVSRFDFIVMFVIMLLFGATAVILLCVLFGKTPKLIINKEGISQNGTEFILWSDIEDIKIVKVRGWIGVSIKFLMIIIKDPQGYIDKNASNTIARKVMQAELKSYGSPISISATGYRMKSEKLHNLLLEKMQEYKPKTI